MMQGWRRWRGVIAGAVLFAVVAIPGKSCGPFFTQAYFVTPMTPDDLKGFFAGQLGVVQPTYWKKHLVVAYRILSGVPLTPAEQKEAARPDTGLVDNPEDLSGWQAWQRVLTKASVNAKPSAFQNAKDVPGGEWQEYKTCLDDAFVTAANTFNDRTAVHPQDKASIANWLQAQGVVFSNCGWNRPPQIPEPANGNAPLWLKQDRAYQIAAAQFYGGIFSAARVSFAKIAADAASPWHEVAEYLVGRCWLREATLSGPVMDQEKLRQAMLVFYKVSKGGGRYAASADGLANVGHRDMIVERSAARILQPQDGSLWQDLQNLQFFWKTTEDTAKLDPVRKQIELIDWVDTVRRESGANDPAAHALARWRETKSLPWLMAAMMLADRPNAPNRPNPPPLLLAPPELLAAARAIPQSSPAWATVTYHRLRLAPNDAASRAELQQVIAQLRGHVTPDTINPFLELASGRAQTMNEFLAVAARVPAAFSDGDDDDPVPPPTSLEIEHCSPDATVCMSTKIATMAGLSVQSGDQSRIEQDTVSVLNDLLPLSSLIEVAQRPGWSKQMQFELAMAAWTRAVVLDRPEDAAKLTPLMTTAEPGWRQWLTAYDAAKTPEERRVASLLALMRFPSVAPIITAGPSREDGFVGYSSYRENWWCRMEDEGSPGQVAAVEARGLTLWSEKKLPPFVTPATAVEAAAERAKINALGSASQYFGKQTLAWVNQHPKDSRNADLLGFAYRAMRNGCDVEDTIALRRQVWETLQKRYPQSTLAKRYPTFNGDNN